MIQESKSADFTISTPYLTITPIRQCEDAQFSPVEIPAGCMDRLGTSDPKLFEEVLQEHGPIAHFWNAIMEMERTHVVILNRRDDAHTPHKERYFVRLGLAIQLRMFIHELSALHPDFEKDAVLMYDTEDRKRRKEIESELARAGIVVKQPRKPITLGRILESICSLFSSN